MTHAFSKKPLYIDAAYVTLKPPGLNGEYQTQLYVDTMFKF